MYTSRVPDIESLSYRLPTPKNNSSTSYYHDKKYKKEQYSKIIPNNENPILNNKTNRHLSTDFLEDSSTDVVKNPFKRTQYLFRAVHSGKHTVDNLMDNHQDKLFMEQKKYEETLEQEIYLFDSFGKHSIEGNQRQLNIKKVLNQQYQSIPQIKICEQYSIINDDYQQPPSQCKQQQADLFFLTQNQQQSQIQQFCFNLNDSTQNLQKKQELKSSQKKMQIKKIIYEFLDQLDFISTNQISYNYINKLKDVLNINCITKMTKNIYLEKQSQQNKFKKSDYMMKSTLNKNQSKSLKTISRNKSQKKQVWRCPGKVTNNKKNQQITPKTIKKFY